MPIPAFDGILNVLPPHLGDPTEPTDLSPYACTIAQACTRFATSPARKRILEGLLDLRAEVFALGIRGFQWLDGSFMEDIEAQEGREPGDIDVVTFVLDPADPATLQAKLTSKMELLNSAHTKAAYLVDHYFQPLGSDPDRLVAAAVYWYALFSHRRDGIWKGMVQTELTDPAHDAAARTVLGSSP